MKSTLMIALVLGLVVACNAQAGVPLVCIMALVKRAYRTL